jgi:hypothetical protein
MHTRTRSGTFVAALAAAATIATGNPSLQSADTMPSSPPGQPDETHDVDSRVRQFGVSVRARLEPDFKRAGVAWPPAAVTLIGLKHERVLEVHAAGPNGRFRFIRSYPILAASGTSGPKLRKGDLQVPEGLYRVECLNPNSRIHQALRVNYPNEFDRAKAAAETRNDLGGDIMIHGGAASIGCLAMGDEAAEDLFVLAALASIPNLTIILSPVDFRVHPAIHPPSDAPSWTPGLYRSIKSALRQYPGKS